jgi:hypothetical protein
MLWAPAKKNASCEECIEIARELNEAYADGRSEPVSAKSNLSVEAERIQAASEALRGLIGGTEEDAERADELLATYRYKPLSYTGKVSAAAMTALRRCAQHVARTGHWLRRLSG